MTEFEVFDSSMNQQLSLQKQKQTLLQSGELSFKLPANRSGKQRINFSTAFVKKPLLNVIVTPAEAQVFDCKWNVCNFDTNGFTICIVNTDTVNELIGSVVWNAMPNF